MFLMLGVLTPVDMRYYLAAVPAVALAAAVAGGIAWGAGGMQRIIALGLFAWAVVVAVRAWWGTLG
jgi:hypothetical protein